MTMRKRGVTVSLLLAMVLAIGISICLLAWCKAPSQPKGFAGSASCRECHEKFTGALLHNEIWNKDFAAEVKWLRKST
jgi:hypothetical protein